MFSTAINNYTALSNEIRGLILFIWSDINHCKFQSISDFPLLHFQRPVEVYGDVPNFTYPTWKVSGETYGYNSGFSSDLATLRPMISNYGCKNMTLHLIWLCILSSMWFYILYFMFCISYHFWPTVLSVEPMVHCVVCLSVVCPSSVTFCIVAKRYVLAKKCLKEWIGNQGQKVLRFWLYGHRDSRFLPYVLWRNGTS